jgi:hypothetical protein
MVHGLPLRVNEVGLPVLPVCVAWNPMSRMDVPGLMTALWLTLRAVT